MKRSHDRVRVAARADGFGVALDDRALDTPAGTALVLPARALAEAIAEEWRAHGDAAPKRPDSPMRLDSMPLMRLPAPPLPRVAARRGGGGAQGRGAAARRLVFRRAGAPCAPRGRREACRRG